MLSFISKPLLRVAGLLVVNTAGFIFGLFIIGGAQRVANYYDVEPAKEVLSYADGVLIQERTNIVAQGPVVVISDTSVLGGQPAEGTAK